MQRIIVIVLASLVLAGSSTSQHVTEILNAEYETKMISSGKNIPAINLGKDNLQDVLVLLHYQVRPEDIRLHFDWDESNYQRRLDILLENEFVRQDPTGDYLPTSMVITLDDAAILQETARTVARRATEIVARWAPEIEKRYAGMSAFDGIPFEDASLLILSNVVLDNWQINNIEELFLKADRTARHGANYYHSIQEKSVKEDEESFGIYGNQMLAHGDLMIGVYGNKRLTSPSLANLRADDYARLFGVHKDASVPDTRGRILEALVRTARDPDFELNPELEKGFNVLGLMDGDRVTVPILSRNDYAELGDLAALVTPDLVGVLEDHRELLAAAYAESVYADEITLEEYLIWWYHFFYSEVTDLLTEQGSILVPRSGITTYIVDWS